MKLSEDRPIGVVALARLGWDDLRALAKDGKLSLDVMGVAADGAQEYLAAMAAGDVATPEVARMRVGGLSGCAQCASVKITPTEMEVEGWHLFKMWCGKRQKANMQGPRPTCGCLVGLKVNGRVYPGPKVWVGSAKCPQGFW